MSGAVTPYSLKDAPALIERLLPVQKLSAEAYKEQMAGSGKTLTALGNYWKGRKPLILAKACVLGSLLPATDDARRDLEVFENLMGMDDESFVARWKRRPKPKQILATLSIPSIVDYFTVEPAGVLPVSAPVEWSKPEYELVKVAWRADLTELERRRLEAQMLPKAPYRERVDQAQRPEEVMDTVHDHIWEAVNVHLGTSAQSFPELVEQLGIMRFGHRPRVADTFCGSGQIPFEAARLGCDVYASDLNPVACMLTWGAFNIVGGSAESRERLAEDQQRLVRLVNEEIDRLGVETDGHGWRAKAFLYCVEARCPQTGWMVPLLATRVVSNGYRVVAELIPDSENRRYAIQIRTGVSEIEMDAAQVGTVGRDGKYGEAYLIHQVDGVDYRTKISTLRGDYQKSDRTVGNRLRLWEKLDFMPRLGDLLQERVYCIQWMRTRARGKREEYEFRSVTDDDLRRERVVQDHIAHHLADWQTKGWVPDMRIEIGGPPRYQGLDLIRARGWTHWHHLFNPRQLLVAAILRKHIDAPLAFSFSQSLNVNARLSRWNSNPGPGRSGKTQGVFDNQALNTLYNFACRSVAWTTEAFVIEAKSFPIAAGVQTAVENNAANILAGTNDIYVTDPPYGDAVKYEEILDFFIAWMRKNPPPEFAEWVWDSRRSLAIKGEDEDFRRNMVAAYKRMTECMPDNGIQVIMFTHQSGSIWADMANIVWASGLQVTAAWYVVTETDSPLREGSYVKGTVLLVLRKRQGIHRTTRDDLAWEIQEEVEAQVLALAGLNQEAKGFYRDENVFEDADIQMAGYAAALRVLTRYATIDGRDMTVEAIRPRVKGETTFVDGLIAFAVNTANQCLVPQGIPNAHWNKLSGAERFYLKMLDMEARGAKTLDNYQNFAKAFKVRDFHALMGDQRANHARLKSAIDFVRAEMSEGSELHQSVLRAVLYAVMELVKNLDGAEVLAHLTLNIPNYYGDMTQRELAIELSDYLAKRLNTLRPEEASAARVLCELVKNQRLG
ncbi:MAG: DNA methylase [Betaproteobacteria bacterium RIFCSPLOWO2_12_FULL_62_58]|nr:MAG: DNA methylase [Betaproteobacteria bacterium RIFCSPLOWO2_12_FULL_62_58]